MTFKNFSKDEGIQMHLAYQTTLQKISFIAFSILTLGILNLIIYWRRQTKFLFYTQTDDFHQATYVLI